MTTSTGTAAFTVSGLTKRFGDVTAVNDISFMAVEATSQVALPQPSLSVIIYPDTP